MQHWMKRFVYISPLQFEIQLCNFAGIFVLLFFSSEFMLIFYLVSPKFYIGTWNEHLKQTKDLVTQLQIFLQVLQKIVFLSQSIHILYFSRQHIHYGQLLRPPQSLQTVCFWFHNFTIPLSFIVSRFSAVLFRFFVMVTLNATQDWIWK